MPDATQIEHPPWPNNVDGKPRQVGVELEFAGIDAAGAAGLVADRFGGTVHEIDSHRFAVRDTRLGAFTAELDTRFVHEEFGQIGESTDPFVQRLNDLRRRAQRLLGDVGATFVPFEIVCPPVDIDDLGEIDQLARDLHAAGAKGTDENPLYAFALQLNPDIASDEAGHLLAVLRAFVLLSDWLKADGERDILRDVIGFAEPFPRDYAVTILQADYSPDRNRLIDDYLLHNPTRNRELDLTPLFAWLDEARLAAGLQDDRVKARPTFHYRLPDARLGDPSWSVIGEWNRWVTVERLASDSERLDEAARAYRNHFSGPDRLAADEIDGAWVRRITDIAGL